MVVPPESPVRKACNDLLSCALASAAACDLSSACARAEFLAFFAVCALAEVSLPELLLRMIGLFKFTFTRSVADSFVAGLVSTGSTFWGCLGLASALVSGLGGGRGAGAVSSFGRGAFGSMTGALACLMFGLPPPP